MIGERVCITGATVRPIDSAVRTVSTTAWSGSRTAFSSDGTSEGTALRANEIIPSTSWATTSRT